MSARGNSLLVNGKMWAWGQYTPEDIERHSTALYGAYSDLFADFHAAINRHPFLGQTYSKVLKALADESAACEPGSPMDVARRAQSASNEAKDRFDAFEMAKPTLYSLYFQWAAKEKSC